MSEPAEERTLSAEEYQLAREFIARNGADLFKSIMGVSEDLHYMRPDSRWALTSALGAYENGVATVLVTRIHRNAKRTGERIDMRLMSGDARLVVDFPDN